MFTHDALLQPESHCSPDRARALALSLDYLTERDLCDLCSITPNTAEAWRKRHKGPAYTVAGNSILYSKASVREFLDSQARTRATTVGAKDLL